MDNGLLRCSRRQLLHINSLQSRQRVDALLSHPPLQLMLELLEAGDMREFRAYCVDGVDLYMLFTLFIMKSVLPGGDI